jgi:hypothetical protein
MTVTSVSIGAIDVTSYVTKYEIEQAYGDCIAQLDMEVVKTISNAISLIPGQVILIYRGDTTPTTSVFNGYIESFEPDGGKIKIIGKDKAWDMVRKEVTHVYDSGIDASAGVISEIFTDLVTTYAGLTANATSVQDSGTTIILDKFVCNHTDIFERCKALAKVLDWQFYYRSDTNKVYFEPKGFTSNTTVLTVGSNIIKVPKWTYDTTEMVNDLTVVGAYSEIETTESGRIGVTTGYTTTGVDITFEPISVKVYNDNNTPPTTLKVGGLPDSSSSFDYYVDKNQKKILPAPGTTFANNSYMEIRYSHAVPIPVHMTADASIAAYGQFKKTLTYNDLRSVTDAETRGTLYLTRYSSPFINSTIQVKINSSYNLKIGDQITVVDNVSIPNINMAFVISRLRLRWPGDYDELVIGDKAWRLSEWQSSVEERLKRLLESEIANQDLIVEVITANNASFNPLKVHPRYFYVNLDDGISEELYTLLQYQNIYDEKFIDDEFEDHGFTTASWQVNTNYLKFF